MTTIPRPKSPQSEPKRRFGWPGVLRFVFSAVLIGVVLYLVNFGELKNTLLHMNAWFLLPAVATFYLDRALMAYKWNPLLKAHGIDVPFMTLVRLYFVAPLAGTLLPSTLGGDAFRLYGLSRYRVDMHSAVASMIVERVIGTLAMLVLASVSLGIGFYLMRDRWGELEGLGWVLLLVVGAVLAVVAALRLLVMPGGSRLRALVDRLTDNRLGAKLRQIYGYCREYRRHKRVIVSVSILTLIEQMAPVAVIFLLVRALNVDVTFLELVVIVPLTVLASRLPISLDGLGVQEGLYVALFALIGISAADALLVSATIRVSNLLSCLPWALHYVLTSHREGVPLAPVPPVKDADVG